MTSTDASTNTSTDAEIDQAIGAAYARSRQIEALAARLARDQAMVRYDFQFYLEDPDYGEIVHGGKTVDFHSVLRLAHEQTDVELDLALTSALATALKDGNTRHLMCRITTHTRPGNNCCADSEAEHVFEAPLEARDESPRHVALYGDSKTTACTEYLFTVADTTSATRGRTDGKPWTVKAYAPVGRDCVLRKIIFSHVPADHGALVERLTWETLNDEFRETARRLLVDVDGDAAPRAGVKRARTYE